jgi:hypothetical protein
VASAKSYGFATFGGLGARLLYASTVESHANQPQSQNPLVSNVQVVDYQNHTAAATLALRRET